MICLNCNSDKFETRDDDIDFPEKGVAILSPAYVCVECGVPVMNSEQMNELLKRLKENEKR